MYSRCSKSWCQREGGAPYSSKGFSANIQKYFRMTHHMWSTSLDGLSQKVDILGSLNWERFWKKLGEGLKEIFSPSLSSSNISSTTVDDVDIRRNIVKLSNWQVTQQQQQQQRQQHSSTHSICVYIHWDSSNTSVSALTHCNHCQWRSLR